MVSPIQSIFMKASAVLITAILVLIYVAHEKEFTRLNRKKSISPTHITRVNHDRYEKITIVRSSSSNGPKSTSTPKCWPKNQVLFLKTHKTGSSTIANILFRYGDFRNLNFVLPSFTLLGWPHRFHAFFAHRLASETPNILCSHSRFNKKPMNRLFPKATSRYITILRNPVDNFESVFNYMQLGKRIGLGNSPNSLQLFLNRSGIPFATMRKIKNEWLLIRNPLLHDLGLNFKFYQNLTAVNEYIHFLDKEFDLVMIMEYFDESLVLMKRLLCWQMEDILYLKLNDRVEEEKNTEPTRDRVVRENIKRWNKADVLLFNHFNKSFWKRIESEGESFREELAIFRQRNREIKEACVTNKTRRQFLYAGRFVKGYELKSDLPKGLRPLCEKMTVSENNYLKHLRGKLGKAEPIEVEPLNYTEVSEEMKEDEESWDLANDLIYEPVKPF